MHRFKNIITNNKNDEIAENKEIIIVNSYGNLPRFLRLKKCFYR